MLAEYGYAFISADDTSRDLAGDILRLSLEKVPHTTIAGNVEQFDISSRISLALRDRWHSLMRQRASSVGVESDALNIRAEKLLVAASGDGEQ